MLAEPCITPKWPYFNPKKRPTNSRGAQMRGRGSQGEREPGGEVERQPGGEGGREEQAAAQERSHKKLVQLE